MKEKIIVKNFSVIDYMEIDIKKINILIGPQATGKSVLAKLIYFFKTIGSEMHGSIVAGEGKKELDRKLRENFVIMFPMYLIKEKIFEVTYYFGDNWVTITNEKAKSYKSFKILYSDEISKKFKNLIKNWKKQVQTEKPLKPGFIDEVSQSILRELERLFLGNERYYHVFIPAVRSFFVNMERYIFSFLKESVSIDYMLTQFGTFLQGIRDRYRYLKPAEDIDKNIYRMCGDVLGGEYHYDKTNEGLWTKDNQFIRLRDSSSGQQEVAPLLVSLMVLSRFTGDHFHMIIEEPEAHLFPGTQRDVVEIIAAIYNLFNKQSGFFITTHSPYILTAFNNLIQAENTRHDVFARLEKGEIDAQTKDKQLNVLKKVVNPNKWVAFDDVAAYLIKDGKCKNIKDIENRLINAAEIDNVSDITADTFGKLLNISFGED